MAIDTRPITHSRLDGMHLSPGKYARLHRLLYQFGPGHGSLMLLPYDQGLEHGPRDFFPNPASADPDYICRIARDGRYTGVVFQYGIAEKYWPTYAGQVALVLKLNGKTDVPSDAQAFSPCQSSVEDAVRLGADAVGYTMYVGSPAQAEDFKQFMWVRQEADRYGMPVIVWAYPRGEAIQAKGGRDSVYAIAYAARTALELGADVVKINVPKIDPANDAKSPKPYSTMEWNPEVAVKHVIDAAGRALVLISGGEKVSDDELLAKARDSIRAGATGVIFGRNVWQRPYDQAIQISQQISQMLIRANTEG